MSVSELLGKLVQQIMLVDKQQDVLKVGTKPKDQETNSMREGRRRAFAVLLQRVGPGRLPDDLKPDQFIKEGVIAFELEHGQKRISPLVTTILAASPSLGSAIVTALFAIRQANQRTRHLEEPIRPAGELDKVVNWWNGGVLAVPSCIERVDDWRHTRHTIPSIDDASQPLASTDDSDRDILNQALSDVRNGIAGKTGFDEVDSILSECEVLLQSHRTNTSSYVQSRFIWEAEDWISNKRAVLLTERRCVQTLLQCERTARPMARSALAMRDILHLCINTATLSQENIVQTYLDTLHTSAYVHSSEDRRVIALKLLAPLATLCTTFLADFFCSQHTDLSREFSYENVLYDASGRDPLTQGNHFITPILPEYLGGSLLADRCGNARDFALRYLDSFQVHFPAVLTRSAVEHACIELEIAVLKVVKHRSFREADFWRTCLLFHSVDSDDDDDDRVDFVENTTVVPQATVQVLKRCVSVIAAVKTSREACVKVFEMHHLLREMETFFMQILEFSILPKLRLRVREADTVQDIEEAWRDIHEELQAIFFLREDIHFLAMENLLTAAASLNVERFRKSRGFFVKCLNGSKYGRLLLETVDQNGFYRRSAGLTV